MKYSFTKIYNQLNPSQKKAVDLIEGPVMVVAGPGTGKTQVLAARIGQILKKTDTPPHSILALTFTDSAAANMRERIVGMIGQPGYYVNISTFHAFCTDVIKSHPEFFPIDRGGEPLTELEKYDLFQRIITENKLDILKPINTPLFYLSDIINAISQLKKEGVSPVEYKKIIDKEFSVLDKKFTKTQEAVFLKNKKKNLELSKIYEIYQKNLREKTRFDFDDMIALVVEAFSKEKLLLREYQEELLYFLVDEYQDTNSAQNKIVELLAKYWGQKANLFVVGDPNQSIFRFQGASIENILEFTKRFPKAEIITLDEGYRTSQHMYDAAHDLISHNALTTSTLHTKTLLTATEKKLKSNNKDKNNILLTELPSQILESLFIADEVKKLMKKGINPEAIAVLYRNNADVNEIKEAFEKWGIPYEIDGGVNVLETETIRQLLQLCKVIKDIRSGTEHGELYEVLTYNWIDIDNSLIMKCAHAAGKAKVSLYELILGGYEYFTKYYAYGDVSKLEFSIAENWVRNIQKWGTSDFNMIFTLWFETVLKESGLLNWILTHPSKVEMLTQMNSLFREIKFLVADHHDLKLEQFLTAIQTMQDHKLHIEAEDLNVGKGSVHLSTVHKAKGREWDYVFIMRCIDGKWGNLHHRELIPLPVSLLKNTDLTKKERNEDERRLFYVALTRARKQVQIAYPKTIISDFSSKDVIKSMFIEEIGDDYINLNNAETFLKKIENNLEIILEPRAPIIRITDYDFYRKLIKDFKLSITALNTYLRNPQEFLENNILRVPRAKQDHMAFGTAVHTALEKFYKARMENRNMTVNELIKVFEHALHREIMNSKSLEDRLQKGREYLERYYERYVNERPDLLYIERFFGFGFSKTMLGDIPLSGRIDRVDWIDRNKRMVRVIDYKTGSSKSVNQIEGIGKSLKLSERERNLPENIRGPYKRQLLFYKLLADLDQTFIPEVTEGTFDFVQPVPSGNFVRRTFSLKKEDVQDMKQLIREVMTEIRDLKFLESS